jgi:hypothetical protein
MPTPIACPTDVFVYRHKNSGKYKGSEGWPCQRTRNSMARTWEQPGGTPRHRSGILRSNQAFGRVRAFQKCWPGSTPAKQRKPNDPWRDDPADMIFVVVNLDPHNYSPWTKSVFTGLNVTRIRATVAPLQLITDRCHYLTSRKDDGPLGKQTQLPD